jgi:hypothetical protein
LVSYRAEIGVRPDEEAVLVLDNALIHADPEAIRVFRANHVRVVTSPYHCTYCLQPADVAWAKSFKDRFSALVVSQADSGVLGLLSMLAGEKVTEASEAMKERAKFVMCAIDSHQKTTAWSTWLKALRVTGFLPFLSGACSRAACRPTIR